MFRPHEPPATLQITSGQLFILDQTGLPQVNRQVRLADAEAVALAIERMQVRGAPLIGVTAAYGVALAMAVASDDAALARVLERLRRTRPTAVNLNWALARMAQVLRACPPDERAGRAWQEAGAIEREEASHCRAIGAHGLRIARRLAAGAPSRPLQVLTHCNAGALATTGPGTALAPVYAAHEAGLAVHVWVSETRPRNQGLLTEWELRMAGVPCTLVADNAAGYLMAQGRVDWVIVGADRIAANGDTANKVGTSLKAYAARHFGIPFHVAAPCSTLDWDCPAGQDIPIELRADSEIRHLAGRDGQGQPTLFELCPPAVNVANPAFDVTPAAFIDGFISERGVCTPAELGRWRR